MRESIYTIPISEAFEEAAGCPFCGIRRKLEARWVEYITGPAMMEPDIRIKTNETGFCKRHYEMTLAQRNRLAVALMLQTRLEWLKNQKPQSNSKTLFKPAKSDKPGCFICETADREYARILQNVAVVWARESDFKALYERQAFVCARDAALVAEAARHKLRGAELAAFLDATARLSEKRLTALKADIDAFCKLYDYRSAANNAVEENVSSAIENAIDYLVGE
jgi:hypothetical protein